MSWLECLQRALSWLDPWSAPWISVGAVALSPLEGVAFVLSLLMVACNLRVNVLGWPLAILSSALYGLLFMRSRLYGEAVLQGIFIVLSVWGWWLWLVKRGAGQTTQSVTAMSWLRRWQALGFVLLAWPALGMLLKHMTDSDVPFFDALPTAGSLLGQWLLAKKRIENWVCWLAVNLLSMALFAYKQLWLTVFLYGIFAALSAVGWRQWLALSHASPKVN
jgi:nicotinamide mononucleotide transporter